MALSVPGLGRKSEAVLNALRQELDGGLLAPGSRLPTEEELCVRFAASRSTVRRATSRLTTEGRIRVRQGSGAFVCEGEGTRPRSRTISVMFPFDSQSLQKVQRRILDMGRLLCVFTHDDWSPASERMFLERVLAERHWALLAFCTPRKPRNEDLLERLEKAGVRVIHVEHYRQEPPEQSFVLPDYRRAGYMGASALMIAGYEELRFVGMGTDGPFAQLAHEGFAQAIRDQRGHYDPERSFLDIPVGQPAESPWAHELVRGFTRPTGLLCRSGDTGNMFVNAGRKQDGVLPAVLGVISISHLVGGRCPALADEIDFDWVGLLERALREVDQRSGRRVQQWVSPTMTRRGTVRQGG